MLEFRILGPFEVVRNGQPLGLGGRKQRALLAALVIHRGEPLSSDRLIDLLWGERPPQTAANTLRVHVANLRKALGTEVLVTRSGGYQLAIEADAVDADRFAILVEQARQATANGDPTGAGELLERALGMWRGQPLTDLSYEPFAQDEIARLTEARLGAAQDRIDADLTLSRHHDVLAELTALVGQHPHSERLLGQLMLALYRSGRQADALTAYREASRRLDDQLGLEPGPELRKLQQLILEHDPGLAAPPPRTPPTSVRGRGAGRGRAARGRALVAAGGLVLLLAASATAIVALGGAAPSARAAANTVAVIDAHTNRVTGAVAVGARPGPIVFGSGSLWVANQDDQTVTRVNPATLQTLRTISLADPPTGIAAAGGGVWVASSSPSGTFVTVSRIDAEFNTIARQVRVGNVVPDTPSAISGDRTGLWVAPYSGNATELDPQTGRIISQFDPNAAPAGIGVGDGAVWVSDNTADTVTRIDRTGLTTPIPVGHRPAGIAVDDGGVWVTDAGDDTLVRIDPDTRAVTATIPVGDTPAGVAVGDGSVWVANSGDGSVSRVDPSSGKVTATIPVGGSPQQVAVSGGRVWVSVDAPAIPHGIASSSTLRIDTPLDVSSMDPALAYDGLSYQLLQATCAKLLNYPDKREPIGSQLVPEVAQSLPTRSPDGRSYTFTIRPGFRFSPPSDQPVTALTFKYTIERVLNPRMRSPVAGDFRDIVGAAAYMSGKISHLAGVTASANTLTIRLTAPNPDLLARVAQPALCAVPTDTPVDPNGVRVVPSAGPYQVASYTPGQAIVLTRNPNYHGNRPSRLPRIEVRVNIPTQRATAQVESGAADYSLAAAPAGDAAAIAGRYGPGSAAAARGRQQYFVDPLPQLDFLALNTHRPLFANRRLRQAVNYAIDRGALAQLGDEYVPLPEHVTDHYLPPGIAGHTNVDIYPPGPDPAKARELARGLTPADVVLYTCNVHPCDQQAQIIKTDLAAIGLHVRVRAYPDQILNAKTVKPGEPFDIVWVGWLPDYLDPDAMLNYMLEDGTAIPTFTDPAYRRRLAAAARLTGPNRYLTYGGLDADLARNGAPFVAFGNLSSHDFFSARIGCQTFGAYGMDLAALCLRPR